MPAPQKETLEKGEKPVSTKYFRDFKGIYTKASRVNIPEDTFYDLVNLMPIGPANLHTIPGPSSVLHDYLTDSIYWMEYANINSTDYLFLFASNGKIFAYNIAANTSSQINSATSMSGAGTRMDQWKNSVIVFADTNGYYSWDGTTFSTLTGGIIPSSPLTSPDIAVFSNRVWIYSNRVLYVSAINSYTDFTLANGAITQNLTDPQMRGQSTRLFSANGYLYILGKSSIFVISDVYIPSGASPPAPVFSILNVQATIGCDHPASVFTFNRDLMFANSYGLWRLSGVTAEKVSDDIDGTIQWIDQSFQMSGGSPKVNNILQSSFLIKQQNDPVFGTRVILANYFDKKWWFASYGPNLTFIATGIKNNQPVVFGLLGNVLKQLYQDETSPPASSWVTALWPMDDQLSDKEVFRAGFEMIVTQLGSGLTATIDTPNTSAQFLNNPSLGTVIWINNSRSSVTWQNNSGATVAWSTSALLLYYADGLGSFGKYVGMTANINSGSIFELNSIEMDYTLRKRW